MTKRLTQTINPNTGKMFTSRRLRKHESILDRCLRAARNKPVKAHHVLKTKVQSTNTASYKAHKVKTNGKRG